MGRDGVIDMGLVVGSVVVVNSLSLLVPKIPAVFIPELPNCLELTESAGTGCTSFPNITPAKI